jgi:hypothetical protein
MLRQALLHDEASATRASLLVSGATSAWPIFGHLGTVVDVL